MMRPSTLPFLSISHIVIPSRLVLYVFRFGIVFCFRFRCALIKISHFRLGDKMTSEEYTITWNEHPSSVVGVFGRFLGEESLVDCTIAAEGKCLKAHRLMLSACSLYFELLFSQEMKKEKVVVLEDIKFEDLMFLIAFMYQGQVTVSKDRLRDFVRAAESLQIKGLPSDLVENLQKETTERSVLCRKEGLASHLSPKAMQCSAIGDKRCDMQCGILNATSIVRKKGGDENSSTLVQTYLSEDNMFPQPQPALGKHSNSERALFPEDKEYSVEPKQEVDVEDTPICDSDDENTTAVTNISSATVGKEIQNELTPVPSTVISRCRSANSPHILEKESKSFISKFSAVTANIPSSTNTASTSPVLPNIGAHQDFSAMEESSPCMQVQVVEQGNCFRNKPVVKSEVPSAVDISQREGIVEPMHEVWVDEMQPWDGDGAMIETDIAIAHNQETTNLDLDVAVAASANNHSAVSCMVVQRDVEEVNAVKIKIELETIEQPLKQQCTNLDVIDRTVDNAVKSEQHAAIEVDEDKIEREEREMEGQEMMRGTDKQTLGTDAAVHLIEAEEEEEEEDSTPLSERLSKLWRENSHQCSICPTVFNNVSDLEVHVKKQHGKGCSYRCEVCMATFAWRSLLLRHMRTHTGERLYNCDVCKMSFRQKYRLTQHKRKHTRERSFQCNFCKTTFSCVDSLASHKQKHTGDHPYQCDICTKSFNHKRNLTVHKRIHTADHPYQCDVCKRSFGRNDTLLKHMRRHTGETPFQCDVCRKSFSDKSNLTVHKRYHTGERPFQCEVCTKSFIDQSGLIRHVRKHTGERPFQCDVCGKCFSHKSHLTVHKRKHTGERPFQCEVCAKTYSRMFHLRVHRESHSSQRSYRCDVCERSFSQLCNLTVHKRQHTGERPFHCNICTMSFSDRSGLNSHMRTHTGERPFHCDFCKTSFRHRSHLNSHVRKHTGERPFHCDVCKMSFSQKNSIIKHMRTHTS